MKKGKIKKQVLLPPIIKIALVDDHSLFRSGVMSLLKDYEELRVTIEAGSAAELIQQLRHKQPHVALVDVEMPGMNGIELTKLLAEKYPDIKVIILSMHDEDAYIFEAFSNGAHGFLPKDKTVDEVVDAIYSVMESGSYYNEKIAHALAMGSKGLTRSLEHAVVKLSKKETEVLKLICRQKTNKEIAALLNVSTRTIESQRNSLLQKTGKKNTAGLVLYAIRHKLVSILEME